MNFKNKKLKYLNNQFFDFWFPLFVTFSLYFGIRIYIAEARYIPSGSMLPGLQIRDRLIIEKLTLRSRLPKRGEIVVFNSPYVFDQVLNSNDFDSSFKCFILNLPFVSSILGGREPSCDAYIKRVVAIQGDDVLVNTKGQVMINGKKTLEPYVYNFCTPKVLEQFSCPAIRKKVPEGHVFVLGDNRRNSWDGRFWPGGGFLPVENILGRAVWRFWPINRIGNLSFKARENYLA